MPAIKSLCKNTRLKCNCVYVSGKVIVMAARRYRIKVSRDGRDYLVLGYAFDVPEHAEREAARLSAETGEEYKVVEQYRVVEA